MLACMLVCFMGVSVRSASAQTAADTVKVYDVVERMPQYPGGIEALKTYLSINVKYPEKARKAGIEGRVVVQFVVAEDGSVCEESIIRGVTADLNEEALRVVHAMYKWTPGTLNGKAVRVRYTLPVIFKLGDERVYEVVDQMPKFPGGANALARYLSRNLKYPANAAKNGIKGRVLVSFVVEKDGAVSDVKVASGADPELDAEAVRVLRSMPKWSHGRRNGEKVRVKYTVPVTFKL